MPFFNIVAETNENTVVTEYTPLPKRADGYQSEAELEADFISMLCEQGYGRLNIHTEAELIANLRAELQRLNNFTFTDDEWQRFFSSVLANSADGIVEKTRMIQEDSVQVLKRDDGTTKSIPVINKLIKK